MILLGAQIGKRYRNILTGEILVVGDYVDGTGLPMAEICNHFPVALIERIDDN